jgi:hypothetical protein
MLSKQCISITDLRTKTSECLQDLGKSEKYIFINNKPVAVLMDVTQFEDWQTAFDFHKEHIDQNEFVRYLQDSKHR